MQPTLLPLSITRAAAWLGVAVTGWSINVHWRPDVAGRTGAPPQFERHIVGATLLVALSAVLLAFVGPARAHRIRTGAIAVAIAIAAHAIAWWVRSIAITSGQPQLIAGSGWRWLLGGTTLVVVMSVLSLTLPKAKTPRPAAPRR